MKSLFKIVLKNLAFFFVFLLMKNSLTRYFLDLIKSEIQSKIILIEHDNIFLKLYVPNILNRYRATTFSTKEPETLKWIDSFETGSEFWDVGANVGLYSCYAASKKGAHVVAFEPSVFNLELLAKNIYINNLDNLVKIFPLALSDSEGFKKFYLSNIIPGGALSSFGSPLGHDGYEMNPVFQYNLYGVSLNYAVLKMGIKVPDYLKIDVDGIEHLILKGSFSFLRQVKSILVEINDQFIEQSELTKSILIDNNFKMIAKINSDTVKNSVNFKPVFNQIWVNKNYN